MREAFLLLADRRRNDFRNFGMTTIRVNSITTVLEAIYSDTFSD